MPSVESSSAATSLAAILGDAASSRDLLDCWNAAISEHRPHLLKTFARAAESQISESKKRDQLKRTQALTNELSKLLEDGIHLEYISRTYLPTYDTEANLDHLNEYLRRRDGDAERTRDICSKLHALGSELEAAIKTLPPAKKGPPFKYTPDTWLLEEAIDLLEQQGLKFATGERSKMVSAIRILWEHANLQGDPRDLIRKVRTTK